MQGLNERVRHYMDWSVNTLMFLALKARPNDSLLHFLRTLIIQGIFGPNIQEVHSLFLQFFLIESSKMKKGTAQKYSWLGHVRLKRIMLIRQPGIGIWFIQICDTPNGHGSVIGRNGRHDV